MCYTSFFYKFCNYEHIILYYVDSIIKGVLLSLCTKNKKHAHKYISRKKPISLLKKLIFNIKTYFP